MLPVLERLLFKPKDQPVTRVLVVLPTRELAVQVYQVSKQLAQFTKIEIALSAGMYFLLLLNLSSLMYCNSRTHKLKYNFKFVNL